MTSASYLYVRNRSGVDPASVISHNSYSVTCIAALSTCKYMLIPADIVLDQELTSKVSLMSIPPGMIPLMSASRAHL